MSSKISAPFLLALLFIPISVIAADDVLPVVATAELSIEERLQVLELRQSELYHTLAQKKDAGPGEVLTRKLTLSGLLEIEGTAASQRLASGSRISASDLALATAQASLGVSLDETTNTKLALLYEEGGVVEVDEATIELNAGGWQGRVGRQYLPFGTFHSHFISDPLTLTLGEARQTALVGGYAGEVVTIRAFAFNGTAAGTGSEDHVSDWGGSLAVTPVAGVEIGTSYLSDLSDGGADLLGGGSWARQVGGWSSFAHVQYGAVTFEAEYLGATRAFAQGDLDADGDGRGDRPRSWNLELAWVLTGQLEVAARLAGSRDFTEQPDRQYGCDLSWSPQENATVSVEYLHGDYATELAPVVGSAAVESDERVSVQLAVAF